MQPSPSKPRLHRRSEQSLPSVLSVAICLSLAPVASSLIINPRPLPRHGRAAAPRRAATAVHRPPLLLPRADTKLKNKHDNDPGDDFATFFSSDGDDEGQVLAREFYKELESRQGAGSGPSPSVVDAAAAAAGSTENDNGETYTVRASIPAGSEGGGRPTIRAVRIQASTNTSSPSSPSSSSSSARKRFTNQSPATTGPPQSFSLPDIIFSLFPPPNRSATSAGLFSGSGATVYSSGRSIRAEIEILETTIKNNEAKEKRRAVWEGVYVGSPEQVEEVLRAVAAAVVLLAAAYAAVELSGAAADAAVASLHSAANLFVGLADGAVARDAAVPSLAIGAGGADVFLGEEAAWLVRESSELAAAVVEAVRSVEELVLS